MRGSICLLGLAPRTPGSTIEQVAQGVGDHVLGVLVDPDISQLTVDRQGRDAVHERPERAGDLARVFAANQSRGLTPGYRVKQLSEGLTCGDGQARVPSFVGITAEHDAVLVRMADGPTHISATDSDQLVGRARRGVRAGGQRGVQVEKSLFGHGSEQVCLIGEVTVRRRGADACPSRRFGQGETLWSPLGHQRQRSAGQRPFEIAVVVTLTAGLRCRGRLRSGHVDDINMLIYVNKFTSPKGIQMSSQRDDETTWAVITGASSGFGAIFADLLAKRGLSLLLAGRDESRLDAVARWVRQTVPGIDVELVVGDLGTGPGIDALVARLEGRTVQLLVNNAGFGTYGPFSELDAGREHELVAVNVDAVVRLTHAVLPGMLARGRGGILNVASTIAFQPGTYQATYGASKAFVLSLSQALWAETRGSGVTVTALCPGATRTGFVDALGSDVSHTAIYRRLAAPEPVVAAGLRALDLGRAVAVPGWRNRIGASAGRISPGWLSALISARLLRPKAAAAVGSRWHDRPGVPVRDQPNGKRIGRHPVSVGERRRSLVRMGEITYRPIQLGAPRRLDTRRRRRGTTRPKCC